MRIDELHIQNFRGIREVHLRDIKNTIVVAGANGSGKSCIFDAIRLLKSAYGGYQQNEWHHWMAEFQINFSNNADAFATFFQDKSKELSIRCVFRLHPDERKYLESHGKDLIRNSVWRLIAPEMYGWQSYNAAPMAAQYREREQEVSDLTDKQWAEMLVELSKDTIVGRLYGKAGENIRFDLSKSLEILFSTYRPGNLGLLDYHGAQRMYTRENVSGINLDLNAQTEQNKNSALYNYNAKYGNVKSEMAGAYVKELLAEKAGVPFASQSSITETLDELFATFFPDKKFLGPQPTVDGALTFPVVTASGAQHDLNELSAGEKEILYGYLRIRNSAPRYSLILLDEPELHLNPRLIRALPRFYHYHLGVALDNQIWLVTHSDALLREVVGQPEYSVFHMVAAGRADEQQIQPLYAQEDTERAVLSLVGDLAAYRPGKKIVVFEGGGDSQFDEYLTSQLFPELLDEANVISSGNKLRVRELHGVLDQAADKGIVPFKTFSITDRDSETHQGITSPRFIWNVYHIENYLLESDFIVQVLHDMNVTTLLDSAAVYDALRASALSTLNQLVRHELGKLVNDTLINAINTSIDPKSSDIPRSLHEAVDRSAQRIGHAQASLLSLQTLQDRAQEIETRLTQDLATDAWRSNFRGRDILKDFVGKHCPTGYDTVRHLIISRMRDAGFKPAGMRDVVDKIIAA